MVTQEFLSKLTKASGVYQMFDMAGNILYVGKAANLHQRVNSYFKSQKKINVKTQSLVSQIDRIEVTVTRSETEALLLETSLIKALRPKYNVLMRDDKSYPYIRVTKHDFPRIDSIRSKTKPKSELVFGPYPNIYVVRNTLKTIQKIFKIRNCSDNYFSNRSRPCLQYQIKRCTAPCVGFVDEKNYGDQVELAIQFLRGKNQDVLNAFTQALQKAVSDLNFEQAAILRDHIADLRSVLETQGVVQLQGELDIIAIEAYTGFACLQWVSVRNGEIVSSEAFYPSVPEMGLEAQEQDALWFAVLKSFLAYFYLDNPFRIPAKLIVNAPLEIKELVVLEQLLSNIRQKKCTIITQPRQNNAKWLDFALNNLKQSVLKKEQSDKWVSFQLAQLQHWLQLTKNINRIDCFDISHTQGSATVASCVVFGKNGLDKKQYRQFNITGITPGDDYAAMSQAVERHLNRLQKSQQELPDILLIDGGKGQCNAVMDVLNAKAPTCRGLSTASMDPTDKPQDVGYKADSIFVLGISKGVERKAGMEKLIIANESRETTLPQHSPVLHLLQRIRDEAHRFAITAHRKKRQKKSLQSELDNIPGIGKKRRQALLHRFGSVRALSRVSIDEIAKVPGINIKLAQQVYDFLHKS